MIHLQPAALRRSGACVVVMPTTGMSAANPPPMPEKGTAMDYVWANDCSAICLKRILQPEGSGYRHSWYSYLTGSPQRPALLKERCLETSDLQGRGLGRALPWRTLHPGSLQGTFECSQQAAKLPTAQHLTCGTQLSCRWPGNKPA